MIKLLQSFLNWIGTIGVTLLVFHNIKLIQENLESTLCILSFLLIYLMNRWIETFSPKYTLKAAKSHSSAVTAGAIKAFERGSQPSPFY